MKRLLSLMLAVVISLTPMLATPLVASAQGTFTPTGGGLTVPIEGRAPSAGRVAGTFTISQFVSTGDAANPVGAVGTLVLRTANGRMIVTEATMPVQLRSPATGGGGTGSAGGVVLQQLTCEILELTLGPLDLNLLGLEIHLDQVHLTIDANPAGGLLGQLLCAIANLLGPGGTIGNLIQLLTLLNQLLALLGGLGGATTP
jgi:hypothetical protein